MDDVAQFGGAHVRKGSGMCCCIHDTLMNMHLYVHVYIYTYIDFTWEPSIFLDIKVCGFSMYIQYGDCELVCYIYM